MVAVSELVIITVKGIFRDRIFQGILALAVLYLLVPLVAPLSMRQVAQLAMTLSFSLTSFILLLLSVFLGATSIWKDIERRYTYSVLSLPLSRDAYLLGRFFGIALFLFCTLLVLATSACLVTYYAGSIWPQERPLAWDAVFVALFYDFLKYVLLSAWALLLSSLSTSFFLPIFGSISIYWVGSFSQDVFDYLQTDSAQQLSPLIHVLAKFFYYLLPNFNAFDLKVNAIYALPLNWPGLGMTLLYFILYTTIILCGAVLVLRRKELR